MADPINKIRYGVYLLYTPWLRDIRITSEFNIWIIYWARPWSCHTKQPANLRACLIIHGDTFYVGTFYALRFYS